MASSGGMAGGNFFAAASTALTAAPTFVVSSFQFGGGRSRYVFDRLAGGLYVAIADRRVATAARNSAEPARPAAPGAA